MIYPSQLTKEAGFEEGVVVEIVWKTGPREYREYADWLPEIHHVSNILSIRPLTGPMAIWNLAPEWATCCQSREMGISWENQIPEWWDGKSAVLHLRPWWCK